MLVSTTRLTTIILSLLLMACAKSGISQDQAVIAADQPSVTQPFGYEAFFPYQRPVDQFNQSSNISNPSGEVRFQLSYFPREAAPNLQVSVNGAVVTTGFSVNSNQLIFQPQPAPNAKITVAYDVENPNDVMRTHTMVIPGNVDLHSLRVVLNGVLVQFSDLRLALNSNGDFVFDPAMLLFNYDDPYHVYASKGLDVQIFATQVIVPGS